MQRPLQITFHEIPHSDAVEDYVRKHAAKLEALAPRITGCRVALERPHRHSRHGEHFRVRIEAALPGGQVIVERSPDEAKPYENLYATIDGAFDKMGRQLQDFVRRQRGHVKAHEPSRRGT
jgi:ribosomal subunit interface protein